MTTSRFAVARDVLQGSAHRRRHALGLFRRAAANDPPIDRIVADGLDIAAHSLQSGALYAFRADLDAPFQVGADCMWPVSMALPRVLRGAPSALGAHCLRVSRPVVVEDLPRFSAFADDPLLRDAGIRGLVVAPVRAQSGPGGIILVGCLQRRLYGPEEAEFVQGVADVLASALYRRDWRDSAQGTVRFEAIPGKRFG